MFYDEATTVKLKEAFGAALLRHPLNPYDAAREIEPNNSVGRANYIVQNWMEDPIVIAAGGARYAELGAKAGLPSKDELALKVYREEVKDPTIRLAYYKFVAELLGFIEKGSGSGVNVNILNAPKVMMVPAFSSEAEWEKTAIEQQRALAKT